MEHELETYHAALRGAQQVARTLPSAIDAAEGAAEAWIRLRQKGEHNPGIAFRAGQNEARELARRWRRHYEQDDTLANLVLVARATSTGYGDALEALALLPRTIRAALQHKRADRRFHARRRALAYFMERTDVRV